MSNLKDTIDKIAQLQTTEESLYGALTENAHNVASGKPTTFSNDQIDEMTTQINTLSATRVNLYNIISKLYNNAIKNESDMKTTYDQQISTLEILENQLNNSKKQLSKLEDKKYDQLKMIQINTFYSKKYDSYRRLFRLVAVLGVLILITIYLSRIPVVAFLSKPLTTLVSIVGIYIIIKRILDMYFRSDTNYDEYNWTSPNNMSLSTSDTSGNDAGGIFSCTDGRCCTTGTVWDDISGCIASSSAWTTTSGMDYPGNDIQYMLNSTKDACVSSCMNTEGCVGALMRSPDNTCWLKRSIDNPTPYPNMEMYSP